MGIFDSFDDGAYVSAMVHVKGDKVKVMGLLRGRMVRTGGVATLGEVDVLDHNFNPIGRTTLVQAKDLVPMTAVARRQMDDMGHDVLCICAICIEKRKAQR